MYMTFVQSCMFNNYYLILYSQHFFFLLFSYNSDRSFPSHKIFIEGTSEGKEGRAALFRVLAVYAMYNPQVSYCQGKRQPISLAHLK